VTTSIREVTDCEVEHSEEHGWVKLDALIDRDLALELLDAAREVKERTETGWTTAPAVGDGAFRHLGEWRAALRHGRYEVHALDTASALSPPSAVTGISVERRID
jgi:hypothetical protein